MNLNKLSTPALKRQLHTTLNKVDNIRLNNLNESTRPVLAHYESVVADIKREIRNRGAK